MSGRRLGTTWQTAGVLAAVLMAPVLHYAQVNLEDKTTACDGELTLAEIIAAVSELVGAEPSTLTLETLPRVRRLLLDGLLR